MSYIPWNNSMLVNIDEIDAQHKKMVDLINRLHEHLIVGEGDASLKPVLSSLIEYIFVHFSAEEKFMRDHGFPNYEEHKHDHDRYVADIKRFVQEYQSNQPLLAREILLYLGDWARKHIGHEDIQYARYIRENPENPSVT